MLIKANGIKRRKRRRTDRFNLSSPTVNADAAVATQEAVFSLLLLCHQLYPIASTHEVMLLPAFICLSVSKMTCLIVNGF